VRVERFCRLLVDGGAHWALLEARVAESSEAGVAQLLDAAPWAGGRLTGRTVSASAAEWLVPAEASKVVAIGQNYRRHAAELGKPVPAEPLLFLKPSTALNAHLRPIVLPEASGEVHYEAELALVIGRTLTRVDERGARDGIFGVTCFNDVTARDLQRREVQHTRAKGYDTFACCGPSLVRGLAYDDLRVSSRLNGEPRQDGRSSDMVFGPATLVAFISHVMTLLPGDLVSTGTPAGVGALSDGDVIEVEIEGVGVLRNPVRRFASVPRG
jgi:2-keto-4-pentenoate hydratase/2-oxohepta-3-ene-1,7-dioic acid hydratase in catechol pathway